MRKVLGWVFFAGFVGAATLSVGQALDAAPPDAEEILRAYPPMDGIADPYEDAVVEDAKEIRGWKVWTGNHPKTDRQRAGEIHRRVDKAQPSREVRCYREAKSYGARLRRVWMTVTANLD